jgi:hypothetical protein
MRHPHADATYRVIPLADATFGVEVAIPDTSPTRVTSFPTEAAAEEWIAGHKQQAANGPTSQRRVFRRATRP